jgi:ABC-type transporter Mla MlaB component
VGAVSSKRQGKESGLAAFEQTPAQEVGPGRPITGARITTFVVRGPISRVDILGMGERLRRCLSSCASDVVVCDVCTLTDPDLDTVDALARLQLIARRQGAQIVLRNAPPELKELLAFAGLDDVVDLGDLEPRG